MGINRMPKRSKYGNKKTVVDGIEFDSIAESKYYRLNKGKSFKTQVPFEIMPKFSKHGINYRAIKYVADFVFYDGNGNIEKVVDVKGKETDVFRLKAKLLADKYDFPLYIVKLQRNGYFKESIFK